MHIEFTNPGFEYMLNSIMEFQKDDVSSFWNDSLFYFFKELDKEYAYSLLPEKRREYFEEKMLEIYRAMGIDKLLVTCDVNNKASEKTILANGGVYENTIDVDGSQMKRYWIEI